MKSDHQPIADLTKPLRLTLALTLAGVTLALGLSGCTAGTSSTTTPTTATESTASSAADPLQSYVDASRPASEAEFERYSDIYSDFALGAEGAGTLVYRYTFRNQLDAEQFQSQLAAMEGTLEATAKDVIIPEMKSVGIDDPVVKWVYNNADGTVIASFAVSD